jgi:aspartyl protease family protein
LQTSYRLQCQLRVVETAEKPARRGVFDVQVHGDRDCRCAVGGGGGKGRDHAGQHATLGDAGAAQLTKGPDGHFWAEAKVDGRAVRFLVDTGATAVSLSKADAQRLGIDVSKLNYEYDVVTADGRTRAASVKLGSVAIAGAKVANVDALVIESGLETSLLGMSYLGRLSRFEATPRSLILHP